MSSILGIMVTVFGEPISLGQLPIEAVRASRTVLLPADRIVAVNTLRKASLDVLVFGHAHTNEGHLFLAHTRCAAIQVALSSTLPNTLATGAIDYLLTSELALPLPAARPAFYSDHTEQVGAPPC